MSFLMDEEIDKLSHDELKGAVKHLVRENKVLTHRFKLLLKSVKNQNKLINYLQAILESTMAKAEKTKHEFTCILTELAYCAFDTVMRAQVIINRLSRNFLFESLDKSELDELNNIAQTVPTEDINWTQKRLLRYLQRQTSQRDSTSVQETTVRKSRSRYKQSNPRSRKTSVNSRKCARASSVSDRSRRASSLSSYSRRASSVSNHCKQANSVISEQLKRKMNANKSQSKKSGRRRRKMQETDFKADDMEPIRKRKRQRSESQSVTEDNPEPDLPKLKTPRVIIKDCLKDSNAKKYISPQQLAQSQKELQQKEKQLQQDLSQNKKELQQKGKQLQQKHVPQKNKKSSPKKTDEDHEVIVIDLISSSEEDDKEPAISDENAKSDSKETRTYAEQKNNMDDNESYFEGEKNQDSNSQCDSRKNEEDSDRSPPQSDYAHLVSLQRQSSKEALNDETEKRV